MTAGKNVKRRGFIGATLIAFGGAVGWVTRKTQEKPPVRQPAPTPLDSRFAYDVSEFEKTDPGLLRYRPGPRFATGLEHPKRIVAAPEKSVWVTGAHALRLLAADGSIAEEIMLQETPHCVLLTSDRNLVVGFRKFYEILDWNGKSLFRSPPLGERTYLTSIATHCGTLYLADAGNREVIVCERDSGSIFGRFGKPEPARNNPGFVVPSPYFDLALASDDRLRIVNPGRLRIETYSLDGRFQSCWGEPGMRVDRFCGCCNPVHFKLTSEGDFITSEKGLTRINLYGADGTFKGVVGGSELLVDDKELARRACDDCTVGAGFDVAVHPDGTVIVLDPFHKSVRTFLPLSPS